MGKLGLGSFGMALTVSDTYLDEAAEPERLGYTGIWLRGGQMASLTRRRSHASYRWSPGAIWVSRSECGPSANQGLACFWWHGTANLSERASFFAGKVLGACGARCRDHLPPP